MKIIHVLKCNRRRCGKKTDLMKTSFNIYKDTKRQYYSCRKCNTDRLKEFRKTESGRKAVNSAVYRSIEKYKEKQNARQRMNDALRRGKIVKAKTCETCKKHKKLDGHHVDYSKALEVIWYCRKCHTDIHNNLRQRKQPVVLL